MDKLLKVFTPKQKETIQDNLKAFINNFEYIRIEKEDYGKGFYVYTDKSDSWTQYCYNIDYLNGWLYGAVQCNHKRMKPLSDEELNERLKKEA